jgi:hypothetical protein
VNRAVLDGARSEQGVVRRVDEERMDEGAVPVN